MKIPCTVQEPITETLRFRLRQLHITNSKIILLGDIEQIDTPYIDSLSNGLTIVVEKMKSEKLFGHITLMKGERSKLATLASKLI